MITLDSDCFEIEGRPDARAPGPRIQVHPLISGEFELVFEAADGCKIHHTVTRELAVAMATDIAMAVRS